MINWPQIPINEINDHYNMCFGCGSNNPIGLKLSFQRDGDAVRAEFVPGEVHQGVPGYVHGGIITCLLDEAMANAAHHNGVDCVTAKMEVRLRQMARVGEPLVLTSSISKQNRKLVQTRASVALKDGTVIAEGTSTLFVVNRRRESLSDAGK